MPSKHSVASQTQQNIFTICNKKSYSLIETVSAFPGILNWQKRLWLTLSDFYQLRSEVGDSRVADTVDFLDYDSKLFDARNYFLKEATFNFKFSHQLSVAISKMQGLTNSIRVSFFHYA